MTVQELLSSPLAQDYYAFDDMTASEAAAAIVSIIQPLGLAESDGNRPATEISDIINGSAIDVIHYVGGHRIVVELDDLYDLCLSVGGRLIGCFGIGTIETFA